MKLIKNRTVPFYRFYISTGRMVALRNGQYSDVPISTITTGLKRVDVRELYDIEQYRPKVRHVSGKPMSLY